ncbi:Uncharacterized protein HZ326_22529 [Fusarium oxysporum f. sp. albedinis]|nr:Uncharacterized protein HZ326_22529 [Fusarium oxysporum f. sp. albedinis]
MISKLEVSQPTIRDLLVCLGNANLRTSILNTKARGEEIQVLSLHVKPLYNGRHLVLMGIRCRYRAAVAVKLASFPLHSITSMAPEFLASPLQTRIPNILTPLAEHLNLSSIALHIPLRSMHRVVQPGYQTMHEMEEQMTEE